MWLGVERKREKKEEEERGERSVAHPTSQLQISKDNEGIHNNEWKNKKNPGVAETMTKS